MSWPVTRPGNTPAQGKSEPSGVGDRGQPVKVELAQAVCDQNAIAGECEAEVAEVEVRIFYCLLLVFASGSRIGLNCKLKLIY